MTCGFGVKGPELSAECEYEALVVTAKISEESCGLKSKAEDPSYRVHTRPKTDEEILEESL